MANYSVQISIKAKKYLDKLSDNLAQPIFDAIISLEIDPYPHGYIKLRSKMLIGFVLGIIELFMSFDNILVVDVIELGHRKDMYK